MECCERGKGNLVVCGVVLLFILGMAGFSVYALVSGDPRTAGETVTQYGRVQVDECLYWGSLLLFVGLFLYLVVHMKKTVQSRVLYDERTVIFAVTYGDERRFSWREVREPDVHLEWVVTPQVPAGTILSIRFEDGGKMAVSRAYRGFWALCEELEAQGIFERYGLIRPRHLGAGGKKGFGQPTQRN